MPNGTVWFARPNTYPTNVAGCSHAPGRPNLNGFISVFRAESLDAALDGKIEQLPMTYELAGAATRVGKLSPTGNSTICFNWEDLNLWVDKRGHLHTFHHGTIVMLESIDRLQPALLKGILLSQLGRAARPTCQRPAAATRGATVLVRHAAGTPSLSSAPSRSLLSLPLLTVISFAQRPALVHLAIRDLRR